MELTGSLQISILSGLIGLKGSANFLNKQKTTHRESSIHVRCQHRTVAKTLSMHHLGEGKIPHLEVARTGANNSATHVVTEIQYGAEATFTFRKRINEMEDRQLINGVLNACGNKLVKVLLGALNGQGSGGSENMESDNHSDVECQFEGDFKLPDDLPTPTNYEEAIKFARQFSHVLARSMVKEKNKEPLGVPCSVFLYPLILLPGVDSAPVLVQEISEITASMCVRLVEDYEDLEEEVADLLNDSLVENLRPLRKKLEIFQQYFSAFRANLKIRLKSMLVDIRSGRDEISSLEQLLNKLRADHFFLNPDRINLWLKQKHEELCMVRRFRDELTSQLKDQDHCVLFFPKEKVLREQMSCSTVRHAIHFAFTSLKNPDPFLEFLTKQTPAMMDEIGTNTPAVDVLRHHLWYRDNNIIEGIEQELTDFHGFIKANIKDRGIVFAMIAIEEDFEQAKPGSSIFVYQKGILHERNYELPTEPYSVINDWDDDSNQLISFSNPIRGNVVRYKITYENDILDNDFTEDNFFIIPYRKVSAIKESPLITITAECIYGSGPPCVFSIGSLYGI